MSGSNMSSSFAGLHAMRLQSATASASASAGGRSSLGRSSRSAGHLDDDQASPNSAAGDSGSQSDPTAQMNPFHPDATRRSPGRMHPSMLAGVMSLSGEEGRAPELPPRPPMLEEPVLNGEQPVLRGISAFFHSVRGSYIPGTLSCTVYRLSFDPTAPTSRWPSSLRHLPFAFFSLPVMLIRKIEKLPRTKDVPSQILQVKTKDFRVMQFTFRDDNVCNQLFVLLQQMTFPPRHDLLPAFCCASLPQDAKHAEVEKDSDKSTREMRPGWDMFDPEADWKRLGVLDATAPTTFAGKADSRLLWRISHANSTYRFCPTYPSRFVTPARLTDRELDSVRHFRSRGRIVALDWRHTNGATMWRSSQPRIGMGQNQCVEDERLVWYIRENTMEDAARRSDPSARAVLDAARADVDKMPPLVIADCRPRANAMANKASGWGYESYSGTQLWFLGIGNIHIVRDAFRRLESLVLNASPDELQWGAAVEDAGWLTQIRTILMGGLRVADAMHRKGLSVLVHCSDGWDRTAQVCGIAELLLDPYYRTLKGFLCLIEKEWLHFGHQFQKRIAHGSPKASEGGNVSPVFVQWLDCVHQLLLQFPHEFEFTSRLLLLLVHHLYSCRFGTFLGDCEWDRKQHGLPYRTDSLWDFILSQQDLFVSPVYEPPSDDVRLGHVAAIDSLLPLHPAAILRPVRLWATLFLRWSPLPSGPSGDHAWEMRHEQDDNEDAVHDGSSLSVRYQGSHAARLLTQWGPSVSRLGRGKVAKHVSRSNALRKRRDGPARAAGAFSTDDARRLEQSAFRVHHGLLHETPPDDDQEDDGGELRSNPSSNVSLQQCLQWMEKCAAEAFELEKMLRNSGLPDESAGFSGEMQVAIRAAHAALLGIGSGSATYAFSEDDEDDDDDEEEAAEAGASSCHSPANSSERSPPIPVPRRDPLGLRAFDDSQREDQGARGETTVEEGAGARDAMKEGGTELGAEESVEAEEGLVAGPDDSELEA